MHMGNRIDSFTEHMDDVPSYARFIIGTYHRLQHTRATCTTDIVDPMHCADVRRCVADIHSYMLCRCRGPLNSIYRYIYMRKKNKTNE